MIRQFSLKAFACSRGLFDSASDWLLHKWMWPVAGRFRPEARGFNKKLCHSSTTDQKTFDLFVFYQWLCNLVNCIWSSQNNNSKTKLLNHFWLVWKSGAWNAFRKKINNNPQQKVVSFAEWQSVLPFRHPRIRKKRTHSICFLPPPTAIRMTSWPTKKHPKFSFHKCWKNCFFSSGLNVMAGSGRPINLTGARFTTAGTTTHLIKAFMGCRQPRHSSG